MWRNWNACALLVRMWNGRAARENSLVVPQKVKNRTAIWSSNFTSRYIPKIIESRDSKRLLNSNVHSSIIRNSWKVVTIQMSIKRWMDKQNVVYPYDGILLSHNEMKFWYMLHLSGIFTGYIFKAHSKSFCSSVVKRWNLHMDFQIVLRCYIDSLRLYSTQYVIFLIRAKFWETVLCQ